jgi:hypothetical protein
VGRRQHLPERRAAQHPGVICGVGDPVGQVRPAAGDQVEAQRRLDVGGVRTEPLGHAGDVDALGRIGVGGRCVRHRVLTVEGIRRSP